MHTRTVKVLRLALTLTLAIAGVGVGPAYAQMTAPVHLADIEHINKLCPGLVLEDNGHTFTDVAASYLDHLYPEEGWGRNAKRGNPSDPSHDALWYPNPRSPIKGSVVDIIGAAGSPGAFPAWIDQTAETIRLGTTGGYIKPSGKLPPCLGIGEPTPPPPGPTPPPDPPNSTEGRKDVSEVLSRLDQVLTRLQAIESRLSTVEGAIADIGEAVPLDPALADFIRNLAGDGPGEGRPNHLTDLLQRLDRNYQAIQDVGGKVSGGGGRRWPF